MDQGQIFKRAELISATFRLIDVLVVILSGIAVYIVQIDSLPPARYLLFLLVFAFLNMNAFSWFSVYGAWRGHWFYKEFTQLTFAFIFVVLVTGTITFLTKTGEDFSRLWAGWTFVLAYVSLVGYRILVRTILHYFRSSGINQKSVLIVGAGPLGKRACKAMLTEEWAGLKPLAFYDDDNSLLGQDYKGIKVDGDIDNLVPYVEQRRIEGQPIDQVWIALPLSSYTRIEELQLALQDTATSVYFVPDLFGFNLASYRVDEIVGLPVMNMSANSVRGGSAVIKRTEDLILSCILLVTLSPLFLVIAILIKKESPGPVFFKQRRYGQDGKEILVWKFRSMTVTDDGDVVVQAQRNDSRVTKVGGWLRKLSFDELPQLINVIQGTMSLVGPRPHAVAHNELYRTKVQGYMVRHQIRPGITGWAQVNGCRGETVNLSDMEERIRYDLEYIRNWSVLLDIRILFRTVSTVLNYKDTY